MWEAGALCHRFRNLLRGFIRRMSNRFVPFQYSGERFDSSFWPSLSSIDVGHREDLIRTIRARNQPMAPFPMVDASDVWRSAQTCHKATGFWPLSFSFPTKELIRVGAPRESKLSPIIPGNPYTFHDQKEYYAQYQSSVFAITHRKGGWDCFRHVEILGSGAIPVMIDAAEIPENSMVHYPKALMRHVTNEISHGRVVPDEDIVTLFQVHFLNYLTTERMAAYVLKAANLQGAERILFVDRELPKRPDYMSLLTLIGLKQIHGARCVDAFPVPYLYESSKGTSAALSGRGFGYSHVLPSSARTSRVRSRLSIAARDYDAVVIGNIARNGPLAFSLRDSFPAERTVWIHGEDQPPSPREAYFLRASGTHTFVRSMT